MRNRLGVVWAMIGLLSLSGHIRAEEPKLLAFPGAEGAGAHARGGRGGKVIAVTSLEDYKPGSKEIIPGTLRAAVEAKGPRIVVFRTGGLIELKGSLRITEPYLTIAGQTAPGDGICLKNYDVSVRDTHDVVIRHLRVRPGDVSRKEVDGLSVYQARDVIIDHCSVSWSVDETLSVTGEGCGNVTIQWCLITESLNNSVHAKGQHGYGSLIRTDGNVTYHHNLYAHHKTRCPRPGTYGDPRGILFDFRNNVIYDWIAPAGYTSEDKATLNYVGNYLKPGPSTVDTKKAFKIGGADTKMFVADNRLEGRDVDDPWALFGNAESVNRLESPLDTPPVATDPPEVAFRRVLAEAGATRPRRDAIDQRVVKQVTDGTGRVIDSQDDVSGWPNYAAGTPPQDTDNDGIPDHWEVSRELDPRDASDGALPRGAGELTHIETYLDWLLHIQ